MVSGDEPKYAVGDLVKLTHGNEVATVKETMMWGYPCCYQVEYPNGAITITFEYDMQPATVIDIAAEKSRLYIQEIKKTS